VVRVERKDRCRGEAGTVQRCLRQPLGSEIFETETAGVFVNLRVLTLDYVVAMVELGSFSSGLGSCTRSCHDTGFTHPSERVSRRIKRRSGTQATTKAPHFFLPKYALELRKQVARPNVV
jgi:hypothetical protein